jgi:peptide chain release factor 3
MDVCRMRNTPMMVFINKLDRPGKDPFDLIDEIEKELMISCIPLSWPIGMGSTFKGVYNIFDKKLNLFAGIEKQVIEEAIEINDIGSKELEYYIGEKQSITLREDMDLINGVYTEFDRSLYLEGHLAPVFFGSALNNFGVNEILNCFIAIAPVPRKFETVERIIEPNEEKFTGFVFKIHANMDPNHRDRIAFVRICSGEFKRNTNYLHVRFNKQLKFSSPTAFMADKKSVIDEAYPGDVIGLHDTGNFKIGDTLTEGEIIHFKGIPNFSPELFKYVENADPMKSKQLAKGLDQLMDEGVAQLFTQISNNRKIIGTVGALQFEVLQHRLLHEYGASCRYEPINLFKACWIESDNKEQMEDFRKRKYSSLAEDKHGREVFLADSSYSLKMAQEKFPGITFHFTSEF